MLAPGGGVCRAASGGIEALHHISAQSMRRAKMDESVAVEEGENSGLGIMLKSVLIFDETGSVVGEKASSVA